MANMNANRLAAMSKGVTTQDHGDPIYPTRYLLRTPWISQIIGGLLLFVASPIIGILCAVVRLQSRGPGIYSQRRVGLDGEVFTVFKIRTMRQDAEVSSGATWASEDDPRITWLGRLLRALHLDELPQLLNVARGEMALVGPRPERPEFVGTLINEIPGYMNRVSVLPGITGLAQINLPPDTDMDSVRLKQLLDCDYIETGSFWLDFRIVATTLLRMTGLRTEQIRKVIGVNRLPQLEDAPQFTDPPMPLPSDDAPAPVNDRPVADVPVAQSMASPHYATENLTPRLSPEGCVLSS